MVTPSRLLVKWADRLPSILWGCITPYLAVYDFCRLIRSCKTPLHLRAWTPAEYPGTSRVFMLPPFTGSFVSRTLSNDATSSLVCPVEFFFANNGTISHKHTLTECVVGATVMADASSSSSSASLVTTRSNADARSSIVLEFDSPATLLASHATFTCALQTEACDDGGGTHLHLCVRTSAPNEESSYANFPHISHFYNDTCDERCDVMHYCRQDEWYMTALRGPYFICYTLFTLCICELVAIPRQQKQSPNRPSCTFQVHFLRNIDIADPCLSSDPYWLYFVLPTGDTTILLGFIERSRDSSKKQPRLHLCQASLLAQLLDRKQLMAHTLAELDVPFAETHSLACDYLVWNPISRILWLAWIARSSPEARVPIKWSVIYLSNTDNVRMETLDYDVLGSA